MAAYEVRLTASAERQLSRLRSRSDRQRVLVRIQALREDPRPPGCSKLVGQHNLYRVRQGRFRILYSVEDARLVVLVIRVADRREAYRDL